MSANATAPGSLTRSLELLAAQIGDPMGVIYEELFNRHPEYEALFFLDPNGDVRGEMLSQAFDILMRADQDDASAEILVKANRFAHDGYGVSETQFDGFFPIIRDCVRASLGQHWEPDFEVRWAEIIDRLLAAHG